MGYQRRHDQPACSYTPRCTYTHRETRGWWHECQCCHHGRGARRLLSLSKQKVSTLLASTLGKAGQSVSSRKKGKHDRERERKAEAIRHSSSLVLSVSVMHLLLSSFSSSRTLLSCGRHEISMAREDTRRLNQRPATAVKTAMIESRLVENIDRQTDS